MERNQETLTTRDLAMGNDPATSLRIGSRSGRS